MITTTTPSVEGRPITAYKGIVVGEAILGAKKNGFFRDGTEIASYEKGHLVFS